MLKVGEPVRYREITNATYDLNNARIYNQSSIDKYSDSRSNYSGMEMKGSFEVEYKTSQTRSWKQSTTVNLGFKVSWSKGIPFVGEAGVEVSEESSESWEWGEEKNVEKTVKYTQDLTIPAMKKITLKVVGSKASCDVPFTCTLHDVMTDGTVRDYTKTDCKFVGANDFGFDTKIISQDL